VRLYLSRWQNRALEKLDVVPVGISRGTPRFPVRYRYLRLPDLYPDGWMFGIEGDAEFNKAYRKKLDRIGADRIGAALKGISDEEGGKDLCLLCFEADPARCHRSAFAAWWEERTDQELPELESCGRSRNRDTRTGSSTEEPDCWPTGQDSGRPTQERLF
jgi:uncharacterized protein DUF488